MKSKAKRKLFINNMITYGVVIAAYIIMQALIGAGQVSSLMKGLLVPFCIYVIMAVSLNLTVGILGELSLGHAGFMCVGAFAGALFSKCMKGVIDPTLGMVIAILIGAVAAALFGILIGIPVLRLRGDYLAIVTLAFGEIIKNLVNAVYLGRDASGFKLSFKDSMSLKLEEGGEVLIKGAQGITGTPQAATFTIGVILVLITLFIVMNLINSRTGRAIMAIRDNRIAAESIGINITKYKLLAFSVSAGLAGVAGVLYAHNLTTLTALPKNFGYNMSIMILVYVVLGGIGSIRGSIIATVILYLLPELLRGLSNYRMLMYAIVLILAMLFNSAPQLVAFRQRVAGKLKHKDNPAKEAI
ncbi:MAG: branched-chain amino acid ABC transporter permease [Clostridiaceae bacterium]|uniref:Branched-chain amino acid ABC transporter permease n=1 Tax=Clostridium porci TaxID=2605778 RepID=A0A7X2NI75_9CLOT|nr:MULTISPECIES: branched-chain amino acid ABC transporter permease [Clostridium]MCI6139347.1 branched-chain amino acid ABC transporter permease [Clostridium sp.]MDY3232560.1 branched-chain amino acid ABC transporter permease [Clostridiaceae bacterium]MSS35309.1 branched-chain amino acid ABC transporter permease [Clostridium porci]